MIYFLKLKVTELLLIFALDESELVSGFNVEFRKQGYVFFTKYAKQIFIRLLFVNI